jgi:nucleoside-diphosphate-sugar epimerase
MFDLMEHKVLMTGITGLIGRWTAAALTRDGATIIAPIRNADRRAQDLVQWISDHGGDAERLILVEGDLATENFLDMEPLSQQLSNITHVYSFAAAMDWGLPAKLAKRVNASAVHELLDWAKAQTALLRFVHISGYLVTSPRHRDAINFDPAALAEGTSNPKKQLRRLYKRVGAYEASKIEADFLVRRAAVESLPITILNPATVIGASDTGEAHQVFGIEGLIDGLKRGTLSAVPGTPQAWTPLVTIDYVAAFAAQVPLQDAGPSTDYVLLNQGTPTLKNMVGIIADELNLKAPSKHIPVWALRAVLKSGMEKRLGTPAETLAFINDYRFDTSAAEAAAARTGIAQADIETALRKTVRFIEATTPSRVAA